jgi:HEAT repeat protein
MILFVTGLLVAQDTDTMIAQLTGKADAPQRNAAQLETAYRAAIEALLPQMGADDVGSRYAPQIQLQSIAAHASRPGAESERAVLARVLCATLQSTDMLPTVRQWFVLQLERMGKAESVPVLMQLMSDPDNATRDYARRALQKNPDSTATEALLKALSTSHDTVWTVGLISALGDRGDLAVVPVLTRLLISDNSAVSGAAVHALSHLDCQASVRGLMETLNGSGTANRMKAAQGLVTLAQTMQAKNDYAGAADVFTKVYQAASRADIHVTPIRIAALNGLVVCQPQKGCRLAMLAIQDDDPKVRAGVVKAARLAPDKTLLRLLSEKLSALDEVSQVQVLGLIADRGDLSSVQCVLPLLGDSPSTVQVAAVDALAEIGCAASAQALLEAAASDDRAVQRAAQQGLALITGPTVDDVILACASAGPIQLRCEAIAALGARTMTSAVPQLLVFAAEEEKDVARVAAKALSSVAGESDLNALISLVAGATDNAVRNEAATTLKAVLVNASDKDAAAQTVIDQIGKASADGKSALLKSLNALGGDRALNYVATAAGSGNEAWKDAAIRTLSDWPDYDAARTLVAIASDKNTSTVHYVVALRGALRLIQTREAVPVQSRADLCLKALDQARRIEEKRQAITVLGTLPVQSAIDRLLTLVKDETVRNEAALAAVDLAGRLRTSNRGASRTLAQTIRDLDINAAINRNADRVIQGRR